MKKRIVTLLGVLFLCAGFQVDAQKGWFNQYFGETYVGVAKMSVDPNDNVVAVGNFSGDINIHENLYTGGGTFLIKLTSSGSLLWHKRFTYSDPNSFTGLTNVVTDGAGNIYVNGQYPESITIDGVTLTGAPFSHNSFLAKFSPDGQLLWTKIFNGVQEIFDLAANEQGDVAVYGQHYGALTIEGVTIFSNGNAIGALFSTEGELQWARTFQTGTGFSTWPIAITLDNARNSHINGKFSGTLQLDGKQISAAGNYSMFFAKLDQAGACEWLVAAPRKVPTAYETVNPPNGLVVEFGDMVTDANGNLFASGTYWTEMKVESTVLPGHPTSTAVNFFLLKLDPAGNLAWARHTTGTNPANTAAFIVSRHDKIYVSGVEGSSPSFVVYNGDGTRLTNPVLLPLLGDIGGGFGVDSEDSVYVSGRRRLQWSDPYARGFVLKYGEALDYDVVDPVVPPPPLGQAGTVHAPASLCVNDEILLQTEFIGQATSYEWEVSQNGNKLNFVSTEPFIVVPVNTISGTGNVTIRVRGRSATQTGSYSVPQVVILETPQELLLTSDCRAITVSKGTAVVWHRNGQPIPNIPPGTLRYTPVFPGEYFATESNGCGIQKSNVINFTFPEGEQYFVPNIITPDGDQYNQFFELDTKLDSSYVSVLNRWGSPVYSSEVYKNNWDGDGLPAGVYYYVIGNPCLRSDLKGTLTISR